jgi:hypothetical protein
VLCWIVEREKSDPPEGLLLAATLLAVNKNKPNVHHDALELPDGKIVLLTHLCEGQHATVLQLPARQRVTGDDAQQHDSLVA